MKTQQIHKESLTSYSSKKSIKHRVYGFDHALAILGVSLTKATVKKKVA